KTQIVTSLLAARFHDITLVAAGTTLGLMLADVPAVLFGERVTRFVPLRIVRLVTAALFVLLGLWVVVGALHGRLGRGARARVSSQAAAQGQASCDRCGALRRSAVHRRAASAFAGVLAEAAGCRRRGGHGGRSCRLVRGDGSVSPAARLAHSAHRAHS